LQNCASLKFCFVNWKQPQSQPLELYCCASYNQPGGFAVGLTYSPSQQGVKRRSLKKMGIQMGKDAEGFLPTNMYTYAALIDQLERAMMIKLVV
jgi:hypothetical protein